MYLKNYHGLPIEAKDFASTIDKADLDATYFKDHMVTANALHTSHPNSLLGFKVKIKM
jgi:hypothetical protein